MILTMRQLRRIIREAMYDPGEASWNAFQRVEREHGDKVASKIQRLLRSPNPADVEEANELINALSGKFHPSDSFDADVQVHRDMHKKHSLWHGFLNDMGLADYDFFIDDVARELGFPDGKQLQASTGVHGLTTDQAYDLVNVMKVNYRISREDVLNALKDNGLYD